MNDALLAVGLHHIRQERETVGAARETLWRAERQLTTLIFAAKALGATYEELAEASGLSIAEIVGRIESRSNASSMVDEESGRVASHPK